MNKLIQYLKEVRHEMTKVTWPNREEIIGGTALVLILSLIFSIVVKIFDFSLSKLIGYILNL